jgi:hypothetical protein
MAFFLGQQEKKPQAHCSDALTACLSEGCFPAACEQAESECVQACEELDCLSEGCFPAACEQAESECEQACEKIDCENYDCESDCEEEEDIGCKDSSCAYWETQCGSSGRLQPLPIGSSVIPSSVYSHIRILASRNESRIFSSQSTFGYC